MSPFDVKDVLAEILQVLSKVVTPKDKTFGSVGQQGSYVDKSDVRQMMGRISALNVGVGLPQPTPTSNRYQRRNNPAFQSRVIRTLMGDPIYDKCGRKDYTYYFCRCF